MSLKASINPSKSDDISGVLAGVDDDLILLTGAGVFDNALYGVHTLLEKYV